MFNKRIFQTAITLACLSLGSTAMAATSVSWLTPPDGTHFQAGTTQTVTGQAAGQGQTGGTGLDLVLVMDASGSMGSYNGIASQRAAADAIITALPQATTSVAIVSFANSATTRIGLTALDSTNTSLHTAVSSFGANGGTSIHAGINMADTVLGTATEASRLQAMVVMSDGGSTVSYADTAADNAMASNTEAIHSVGMGLYYQATALQASVNGVDNIYDNADDYGTFVGADFANLIGLFSGTTGNLVGLDHIDITLPDSTVLWDHATDGLGNFTLDYMLAAGANVFSVTAYGDDLTSATASWTLYGDTNDVPEPSTVLLFGIGLAGLVVRSRKKMNK